MIKKEVLEPSRRSRRIAGIKSELEDPEQAARIREEEELKQHRKQELERLKRTRLFGDFKLIDLITNKKGDMIFEKTLWIENCHILVLIVKWRKRKRGR